MDMKFPRSRGRVALSNLSSIQRGTRLAPVHVRIVETVHSNPDEVVASRKHTYVSLVLVGTHGRNGNSA